MYTFLFACIPAFLLLVCFSNGKYSWKSFIPPVAIGFLVAFVFYICKKFMIFNRYVWTVDMVPAVLNGFVYDVLIPFLACLAAFFLFDRSKMRYKAEAVGPLMLMFYAFMVPFGILTGDDLLTPFMIYGKPLLFVGMVLFVSSFASLGVGFTFGERKLIPLGVLFFLLIVPVLFVPSLIEALWYYEGRFVFVIVSAVFAGLGLLLHLARNVFVH